MSIRGRSLYLCLALLSLSHIGCGEPVKPGSDMAKVAPPAVLGAEPTDPEPTRDDGSQTQPEPGLRLDGRFDVFGDLDSPLGGSIEVTLMGQLSQEGDLNAGAALMDLEIISDNEAGSARFESPAPVSLNGEFSGRVVDYLVSHEFSDLLTEDVYTDLYFQANIMTEDCFYGGLGLQLKEARIADVPTPVSLRLNGRFIAVRVGAACNFGEFGVDTTGVEMAVDGDEESQE